MSVPEALPLPSGRRHDLDALRAFAMLLGIALHASLSFFPAPWPAQDTHQNSLFGLFLLFIHGFRMPLFFIISGFFTMMLYRRRGLASLLRQRTARILVPCLIGLVTIVPLTNRANDWALNHTSRPTTGAERTLIDAIREGDHASVEQLLAKTPDLDVPDKRMGITPLSWAAMKGDVRSVTLLVERGANINAGNRDGSTPLHSAAFLGRHEVAELLIARGADPAKKDLIGLRAIESTYVDWGITSGLAEMIGIKNLEKTRVDEGRKRIRDKLAALLGESDVVQALNESKGVISRYRDFVNSPVFQLRFGDRSFNLFRDNVFDHLWFLWYLSWLVAIFAAVMWAIERRRPAGAETRKPSLGRAFRLLPISLIPQWFQGLEMPAIGPDTSTGILPLPHILAYYLCYFAFGALYYDADDTTGRLGKRWWLLLPVSVLILFPACLVTMTNRSAATPVQAAYTWGMAFGLMGLFRAYLKHPSPPIRYVSDASYWMYVAHQPLVIYLQATVSDWNAGAMIKFLGINLVTTVVLLVAYQLLVRNTVVGVLLNGRRARDAKPAAAALPTSAA